MEQSFDVAAPIDEVWKALIDIERVAPCLPGASITDREADGSYKGTFEVKLGPTTASYRGVLRIEEADESAHRAVLNARGTDKRGQGGAAATIVNTLTQVEGGTRVHADTDFTITGRLARFGRGGMIEDISNRLLREFATCLQANLASAPVPAGGDQPAEASVAAAGGGRPSTDAAAAPAGGGESGGAGAAGRGPETGGAEAEATAAAAAGTGGGDSPAAGTGTGSSSVPPRTPSSSAPRMQPTPQQAKPISGISLVLGVLYQRLARLFGRPGRKRRG